MKNTKCPEKKFCINYKGNYCEGCSFGDEITKLHKRIDRLKKQNETLTIQRNAWALTAKALTHEWISVDERLPEVGTRVVGYDYESNVRCYFITENRWWIDGGWNTAKGWGITHWMPLPEPPKMKDGE